MLYNLTEKVSASYFERKFLFMQHTSATKDIIAFICQYASRIFCILCYFVRYLFAFCCLGWREKQEHSFRIMNSMPLSYLYFCSISKTITKDFLYCEETANIIIMHSVKLGLWALTEFLQYNAKNIILYVNTGIALPVRWAVYQVEQILSGQQKHVSEKSDIGKAWW